MRSRHAALATMVLPLAILACNLQAGPSASKSDLPGTITAQALTLQAPLQAGTPSAEAVQSAAEVSVTSETNCRMGPGQAYDNVFVAEPEQSFRVVGKSTSTNYWIINSPAGGTCWLWGQYVVLNGDASSLPEFPAPAAPLPQYTNTPKATKTPKPTATTDPSSVVPGEPQNLQGNYSCKLYLDGMVPKWLQRVNLTWVDGADNESGYRILWEGQVRDTLLPNSTSYFTELRYAYGGDTPLVAEFVLAAFNAAGYSGTLTYDVPRCIKDTTPSS